MDHAGSFGREGQCACYRGDIVCIAFVALQSDLSDISSWPSQFSVTFLLLSMWLALDDVTFPGAFVMQP